MATKPLSVYAAAVYLDSGFANGLSLAVIISTSLMASLSFGTYRLFLRQKYEYKKRYFLMFRRGVFCVNVVAILLFMYVLSCLDEFSIWNLVLLYQVVVTEHIIHDESRVILYEGDRTRWAKHNCIRTIFIPIVVLCGVIGNNDELAYITMCFMFSLNILYSFKSNGLCRLNLGIIGSIFRVKFWRLYFSQFNYFFSASLSKLSQQSDRFLFGFLNYNELWKYIVLVQIATIPLTAFEVTSLSHFKSTVKNRGRQYFGYLNTKEMLILFYSSFGAITIFVMLLFFNTSFRQAELYFIFLQILAHNFLAATAMMNSERLFWQLGNPKKFMGIELGAFSIGHIISVPFVYFGGLYTLVKIPSSLSLAIKLWRTKKCLNI